MLLVYQWLRYGLLLVVLLLAAGSAAGADNPGADSILQAGTSGTGTYGYYVARVGGGVVTARNEGFVFEPASALKTLYLAYAMRQVASGADALSNSVTVYTYPNNRNHLPADDTNLCPSPGDEVSGNATTVPLTVVLTNMMGPSDNRSTRAL